MRGHNILRHLPQWFIAVFALTYVSGYLIEFLYYASIGIVDPSSDILKLKYIQTGIHFLLFLLFTAVPIFIFLGRSHMNPSVLPLRSGNEFTVTIWNVAMAIFYFASIYFAALFAPLHYFQYEFYWLRWLALIVLVFVVMSINIGAAVLLGYFYKLDRTREERNLKAGDMLSEEQEIYLCERGDFYNKIKTHLAQALIVVMALLDIIIFYDLGVTLKEMLFPYGIFFFCFSALLGMITYRVFEQLGQLAQLHDEHANFRYVGYAAVGCIGVSAIFFLALASYSYVIFAFIPNMKGGADYQIARKVSFLTTDPLEFNLGAGNLKARLDDVIIMYATSSSYYVAWPTRGNDACDWRAHRKVPIVAQVSRDMVRAITVKGESSNCY
jgi:hypothetical protein